MTLLKTLQEEKESNLKGGIYHQTQIQLAYNTNRIEGSKLSEEQTRYIFETNTVFFREGEETANVDDIVETINHFTCFDYMLDIAFEPLSETHLKKFHLLLKISTSDSKRAWFKVGEYKAKPNVVGGIATSLPTDVPGDIKNLIDAYNKRKSFKISDIIDFHYQFEKIHPFQDGNGRVGRLIMFKECLKHGIVPFIIEDEHKFFYYRGLSEYPKVKEYLIDTCLSAQDSYKRMLAYFSPKNDN